MKLYLETTMFNYYFDESREGHADTVRLFAEIREGRHKAYTSEYAVGELLDAPEPKRTKMIELLSEYNIETIHITAESDRLADLYVAEGIIPSRFRDDSAHIAVASINDLDCILSYNFQHKNRLKTKVMTERINRNEGYKGIVICTAKEVLEDEQTGN